MSYTKLLFLRSTTIFLFVFLPCAIFFDAFLQAVPQNSAQKNSIDELIHELSPQEKEYLTNFFRHAFFISSYGYTLYGDKPMSFETINLTQKPRSVENIDYMDLKHILGRYRLREGFEVWQKYQHRIPLKGFSLFYCTSLANSDYVEIVLINHENFLRAVRENLSDFHTVLEGEYTPEQIFSEYIKGEGDVFQQIRLHDGLFGTLLGFGRENSWEYYRRNGGKTLESFWREEPKDVQHVLPPLFAVIPNTDETTILKKNYSRQRDAINVVFKRDDFLEQVLFKLSGVN